MTSNVIILRERSRKRKKQKLIVFLFNIMKFFKRVTIKVEIEHLKFKIGAKVPKFYRSHKQYWIILGTILGKWATDLEPTTNRQIRIRQQKPCYAKIASNKAIYVLNAR